MKRGFKILLFLVLLAVLAGLGGYWYAFKRPHQNMLKAKPEYAVEAGVLFHEYTDDEVTANKKYLGKVIEITGKVIRVEATENRHSVILEDDLSGVISYLDSSFVAANREMIRTIDPGHYITLRGQCDGMLNDVVISRAVIIQ